MMTDAVALAKERSAAKTDKEYHGTSVMDMPKNWFNFDNYVQAFVASNMADRKSVV